MPNEVTLVHETKKPNTVTSSKPATITQLRSEGYRVVPAEEAPAKGYDALLLEDLRTEVARRNETREDPETHVVPEGRNKPDFVAALEADDAAQERGDDQ